MRLLRLLNNMASQGCEMNVVAYCTVVGGFYEEGFKAEAFEVFGKMIESGVSLCVSAFNKVLHVLCKRGDVKECEKLLEKVTMPEKLFQEMVDRCLAPDGYTHRLLIDGF
ncbi:unnamed protein product [Microthlaspi erraticum]|uniref:Pentacotripeptide-repeat region of PRORP domain-containing protein n=1 Tax=Microthlaspi erraticum TaxID=1685480 RepID=A0A6D2JQL6_9BRAS|nr:unnamed protein product [Microthlaspi erraticum]